MYIIDKKEAYPLQILARQQLKHKLLADINIDLTICKLEWRDYKEYLLELKKMIDEIVTDNNLI